MNPQRQPRPDPQAPVQYLREVSRADFVGLARKAPEKKAAFHAPTFVAVGLTLAGALAAVVLLMYVLPPL